MAKDFSPPPSELVKVCRAKEINNWVSIVGAVVSSINFLFVIFLLAANEPLDAVGVIADCIFVLELGLVIGLFILFNRRTLEVKVYTDKIIIRKLKRWVLSTQSVLELPYAAIDEIVVVDNNRLTIKYNRKKYTFFQTSVLIPQEGEDIEQYYSIRYFGSAFNNYNMANGKQNKITIKTRGDASGLLVLADIIDLIPN